MCIYILIIIGIDQYKQHIVITLLAISSSPSPHCLKPGLSEYGSSQVRVHRSPGDPPPSGGPGTWSEQDLSCFRVTSVKASCPEPDQTTASLTNGSVSLHPHCDIITCGPISALPAVSWSLCYRTCRSVSTRRLTVQVSDITSCQLKQWHHIQSAQTVTSHPVGSNSDITSRQLKQWHHIPSAQTVTSHPVSSNSDITFSPLLQIWGAAQVGGFSSLCSGIGWRGCQSDDGQTVSASRNGGTEERRRRGRWGWEGDAGTRRRSLLLVRGGAGGQEELQVESPGSPGEWDDLRTSL